MKNFTDRIEFKKLLIEAVEEPQRYDEHRIKVIYGLGGQGKSFLRTNFFVEEYLASASATNHNLIYCDGLDFERIESSRTTEGGLLSIAKVLIEQGGIPLPAFSLAFFKLKQLTSLTSNLEEQFSYMCKLTSRRVNNGGLIDDVIQEIIEFGLGSGLSEVASTVPLIGYFIKKLTNKGKSKVIEWLRESDAKDVLEDLDEMDKYELLEKLPFFLGWDVYKAQKATAVDGIPKKRIVIIIDGYEALWSGENGVNFTKDLWIRQLSEYMTGVLFVIFGRESLRWSEVEKNEDLLNGLQQFSLDGFDDEDAEDYLLKIPIIEADIRSVIKQNAKGSNSNKCFPLYLQLEAKTYENIINKRVPVATDFSQGNEKTETEIVTRLFKHLDRGVANALEALSLCNYIDEEIIELLEQNIAFAAASVSMKTLGEYSFILKEKNRLYIHGFVKEVAAEQYELKHPSKFKKIHEALFNYFDRKLTFKGYRKIDIELESMLDYASAHLKTFCPERFPDWILEKSNTFYGDSMLMDDVLKNQLHAAVDYLEAKYNISLETFDEVLKLTFGKLLYQLANRYYEAVNYTEALRFIKLSILTFESLLSDELLFEKEKEYKQNILSNAEINRISWYQTVLAKAAELHVLTGENISAGEYFSRVNSISFTFDIPTDKGAFAIYLGSVGRYAEAESFFFNRVKEYRAQIESDGVHDKNNTDPNFDTLSNLAHAASSLSKVLRYQERYEEAKHYIEIVLDLMREQFGADHLYTSFYKQQFGRLLALEGSDLIHSKQLLDEVREVYKNTYSPNHLYYGHLNADYFSLLKHTDPDEATDYYLDACRIYGNRQTSLSKDMVDLMLACSELLKSKSLEDLDKADAEQAVIFSNRIITDLFYEKFDQVKNLYGIFSPTLHKGMRLASKILEEDNEILKSEELHRKALEFERIMNLFYNVRICDAGREELADEEKIFAFNLFKGFISLPESPSSVVIEVVELPFYKTVDLFKITHINPSTPTIRYVLSNMKNVWLVDHTNRAIYDVGEFDLNLHPDNVIDYAIFFMDTTIGRQGHFHVLKDYKDIPWMSDVYIPENYKNWFESLIPPIEYISQDDERYHLKSVILFKQSLFHSDLYIDKNDGKVSLDNEKLMVLFRLANGEIGNYDSENPPEGEFQEFKDIPATIDPIYSDVLPKAQPETFEDFMNIAFTMIEQDIFYVHSHLERSEEESNQFESFLKSYREAKDNKDQNGRIHLSTVKELLIFNYNANVTAHNNYTKNYDFEDQFPKAIRNKLDLITDIIRRIDNYATNQEANN